MDPSIVHTLCSELNTYPPKTTVLQLVLQHLITRLKMLTPRRLDIHATIDETIDVSLICQMVEHGAITREDMMGLVEFCFKHIKRMQCPADDSQTEDWHTIVTSLMEEDEFSPAAFFPVFLKDTLLMVQRIQHQIDTFIH